MSSKILGSDCTAAINSSNFWEILSPWQHTCTAGIVGTVGGGLVTETTAARFLALV